MKMWGLVVKGNRDLLRVESHNGPEEGEITHGPWYTLSDDWQHPVWLVGNYDVALQATKYNKDDCHKSFMYDDYNRPATFRDGKIQLEVVEVTLTVR